MNSTSCILSRSADVTYSKNGIKIPEGEVHLRLHLNIFNLSISQFDIKAYENMPENCETFFYQDLYLDLQDAASRLHLSKWKIRQHQENKTLDTWWDRKLKKISRLIKLISHYETIQKSCEANRLFFAESMHLPTIKNEELMKLLNFYHKRLDYYPLPCTFILKLPKKMIDKDHLFHFSHILTHASVNENYHLVNITEKSRIMHGSWGTIDKVHHISLGIFSVIKDARTDYDEYPEEDREDLRFQAELCIRHESNNLNILNSLGLIHGFQKPPYFTFKSCYVGYYYNRIDLVDCLKKIPFENRLMLLKDSFEDLLHALNSLHALDYFNHDIKPENIFVEFFQGKYKLCFGDVAELRKIKHPEDKLRIGIHTPSYSPFSPEDKALYPIEALKAFDVYQLGASFFTTLTDVPPYLKDADDDDYPDFNLEFNDSILSRTCSSNAIFLIKSMCEPDEKSRFTIGEACEFVNSPTFRWTI